MINLVDPSMSLLAASGGDTVKLFDVSVEPGDPCTLNYTPTPDLVVASAGEDKRFRCGGKMGRTWGQFRFPGTDNGDNIEVILRRSLLIH
ncbi:hypothetical protein NC652_034156 [Populus alba x Populus x berolinensis]|nr:hypothetical protein NC652_034156 [Populus alba x Populus x berolinensis]